MSRYDNLVRALASGDIESSKAFWRSKQWTADERARARRLLTTARDLCLEVLA